MKHFKILSVFLVLMVPGLVIFFPLLFAGQIFADGDALLQFYPSLDFFSDSLRDGVSFLWNPYILTGFPTVMSALGGFLSPLNRLVFSLFSAFSGYHLLTFLNFFLVSVFTYLLVRALALNKWAAVFSALVLPWTMAYFLWSGNITVTAGYWLLPALFFFALKFLRANSLSKAALWAVFSGGLTGVVLLASHLQWPAQAMAVSWIWALFLDFRDQKGRPGFRLRSTAFMTLAFIIALAVAWPQLSLNLQAREFSARLEGVSFAEAQADALIPADLLSLVFPALSIPLIRTNPGILYLGAVPLFLFLFSWLNKKNAYQKFFLWLAGFSLLASVKFSPLMWLLNQLPVFDSFRALSRFVYVAIFGIVVAGAYGLQSLISRENSPNAERLKNLLWRVSLTIFGLFIVGSVILFIYSGAIQSKALDYFDSRYDAQQYSLPIEHYHLVIERMLEKAEAGIVFPNMPITISVLSFALAGFLFKIRDRITASKFNFYLISLAALNLILVNSAQLNLAAGAQVEQKPPPAVFLENHNSQSDRIFTFLPGFTLFERLDTPYGYDPVDNLELQKNLLNANLNMFYKTASLDYYDNLMDRRHGRILAYLGSNRAVGSFENLAELDIPLDEKKSFFLSRMPILSEYSVKYIISAYPLDDPDLQEVLRWSATRHDIRLFMYENQKSRPKVYLTSEVVFSPNLSEAESWQKNLESAQNGNALIECDRCPENPAGEGTVRIIEVSNSEYVFETRSETAQMFIFGVNFLPGWIAELDGQSVEIFRANFINQAIAVPPGEHQIIFRYQAP